MGGRLSGIRLSPVKKGSEKTDTIEKNACVQVKEILKQQPKAREREERDLHCKMFVTHMQIKYAE